MELRNRRDAGYTIISRFEESFREFLSQKLLAFYSNFIDGIPKGIISKILERSEITDFTDPMIILEESDFPDLLEIIIFSSNFENFCQGRFEKEDLRDQMSRLYGLRCKIAHVKNFFTSVDLDVLLELSQNISTLFNDNQYSEFLKVIKETPDEVVIKIPNDFYVNDLQNERIVNNLPVPDYEFDGGFVGRSEDIKKILKLISNDKFSVVTLSGAGGVGKTSLALKVCQEIINRGIDKFEYIVWLTAKENRLSALGIEDIEPTLRSYEELLETIITACKFDECIESESVEDKEKLVDWIFDASQKILILVDNLETITDERIINFIIDAPQHVKFFITSRKGLGQLERRYEVTQLKEKEAINLLRHVARDKGVHSLANQSEKLLKKYVNKVACYPLVIKWVIGQVARGKDINKVIEDIDSESSDVSKFCFEQIFNSLTDNCKRVLYSLSCFDESPTASVLQYSTNLSDKTFDDAIEELILVSLVIPEQYQNENNEISRKFNLLSLTRGFIRKLLTNDTRLKNQLESRLREVEQSISKSERAKREYKYSLHNFGATTDEEKVAAIIAQTAFQKYQNSDPEAAREEYRKAIGMAPKFSAIYRNWAVMESYESNLVEAEQLMNKASELKQDDPQIWLQWGNIHKKAGRFKEAKDKYERANQLTGDDHIILNALGQTYGRLGLFEKAHDFLIKSLNTSNAVNTIKHEIINRTSIAENLINWAWSLTKGRNYELAEEKFKSAVLQSLKAIDIDRYDTRSYLALTKANYRFGLHYLKRGNDSKAIEYLSKLEGAETKAFTQSVNKIKGLMELGKIYFKKGDYSKVKELLLPLLHSYHNIFARDRYKELKFEIQNILDAIKEKNLIVGKITRVSVYQNYVIIQDLEKEDETYIANNMDFKPELTKLGIFLKGRVVKFFPKNYIGKGGSKKNNAKNIIILE